MLDWKARKTEKQNNSQDTDVALTDSGYLGSFEFADSKVKITCQVWIYF